jgi:spectinomycin phosphotransferase
MRERPAGLDDAEVISALAAMWAIDVERTEYLPVGAGSYHWSMVDRDGTAWFVKVDDLGVEDGERDHTYDRLTRSLGAALALQRDAELTFVLAPIPTRSGAVLSRLTSRYAVSVYPMVAGAAGEFGLHRRADRTELVDLLASLHMATPAVADIAVRADLVLPGRDRLQEALRDLGREWTGGPYAESARKLLATNAESVEGWLGDFDRLVDGVRDAGTAWVVTHGEPHPGNVMRTPAGLRLIDWDTVQVAPPERDLWMLTDAFAGMLGEDPAGADDEVLVRYADATGHSAKPGVIALYPLWWKLADIAIDVDALRRPHVADADRAASLRYLTNYLS